MSFDGINIKARNYKAFSSEWTGFDKICGVNLVVGRNNTGKSALLDIIEFASRSTQIKSAQWHKKEKSEIAIGLYFCL